MNFSQGSVQKLQLLVLVPAALVAAWLSALLLVRLLDSGMLMQVRIEPIQPLSQRASLNWYQRAGAPEVQQVAAEEDLQEARVNATLLGVVLTPDLALASIALPGKRDGVYQAGDNLQPGVVLESVEATRVVVSEAGARRQISLEPLGRAANSGGNRNLVEVQPAQDRGFSLAGVIGGTPMQLESGEMGMRLDDLSPEVADLADLQIGDVVFAIDGIAVADLLSNPDEMRGLVTRSSVPVRLQRDGEPMEIYLNASSLAQRILPQMAGGLVQ